MADAQIETSRKLATALAADLDKANDFLDVYAAVVHFIEAIDTEAHVLGDGDLAGIAGRACERRGKSAQVLLALAETKKIAAA